MKKRKRVLYAFALVGAIWIAFSLRKVGWESDFGRPWHIDIEETISGIDEIPKTYRSRFRSLGEYQNFVRQMSNGLSVTLYDDKTASMNGGWAGSVKPVWQEDDDFDYWIYTRSFLSAGVGHGFTRRSAQTARLTYQLEWNENTATRECLVLRR